MAVGEPLPGYPQGETRLATGVQRGVYDRYGQLLDAHLAKAMPGVRLELDNSEGSIDNLRRVTSGRDDFAIATADAVAQYTGPGREKLRAIARLYDDYLQLIVPAGSRCTGPPTSRACGSASASRSRASIW